MFVREKSLKRPVFKNYIFNSLPFSSLESTNAGFTFYTCDYWMLLGRKIWCKNVFGFCHYSLCQFEII